MNIISIVRGGYLFIIDAVTGEVLDFKELNQHDNELWCGATISEWNDLYKNASVE